MNFRIIEPLLAEVKNSTCMYKHGGVIVVQGKIVGAGCNKYDSRYGRVSIHSEIATILNAKRGRKNSVRGGTLYVARVNNQNCLRNSIPCENCVKYMRYHGIAKVVYSTDDGFIETSIDVLAAASGKKAIIKIGANGEYIMQN